MSERPISEIISEKLLEVLCQYIEDIKQREALAALVPALMELAQIAGIHAVEEALEELAGDDPYPAWSMLITAATVQQRVTIMETARQAAIQDTVRKIKRKRAEWTALITAIKVALSLLPLLL